MLGLALLGLALLGLVFKAANRAARCLARRAALTLLPVLLSLVRAHIKLHSDCTHNRDRRET